MKIKKILRKLCLGNSSYSRLIAHRGHQGFFPDNSLEGIEHALMNGSNHLELDVAKTADDELVLAHWALNLNSTDVQAKFTNLNFREDKLDLILKEKAHPLYTAAQNIRLKMEPKFPTTRRSWHVGNFKVSELKTLTLDYEKNFKEYLAVGTHHPIGYLYPFRQAKGNSGKFQMPTLQDAIILIQETAQKLSKKVIITLDLKTQPFIYDDIQQFNKGWETLAKKIISLESRIKLGRKIKIIYFSRTHQLLKQLHNEGVKKNRLGLYLIKESEGIPLELVLGAGPTLLGREILYSPEDGEGTIMDVLAKNPKLKDYIGIIVANNSLTKQNIKFIRQKYNMQVAMWNSKAGMNASRSELHPQHPDHAAAYTSYKIRIECAILRKFRYLIGDYDGVAQKALSELGYI